MTNTNHHVLRLGGLWKQADLDKPTIRVLWSVF